MGERTAQLEERFYQTLDSLANALEEKDPYTVGHSLRVEKYLPPDRKDLGLSADCQTLSISAKLHDIGKIGIPGSILNRAGNLAEEESRIIVQHPREEREDPGAAQVHGGRHRGGAQAP